MGSQPLVSICIPSYNGAQFIVDTIESVLHQSFEDFEIIVLDDASTDDTVAIIQRFKDRRVRLVRNPVNLGMGANWNRVLSLGLGKYVKLLCEDDVLSPDCLERQVAVLESHRHHNVALAICNRDVIDCHGKVVLKASKRLQPGRIGGRQLVKKCLCCGSNVIGEPAVGLFRRELLKSGNVCDPSNPYVSDLSLWAEVLRHGDAFVDPEVLASFRVSSGAATASIGLKQASSFWRFARQMRRDRFYRASAWDLGCAYLLSTQWCLLRNAFIHFKGGTPLPGFTDPAAPSKAIIHEHSHANCA